MHKGPKRPCEWSVPGQSNTHLPSGSSPDTSHKVHVVPKPQPFWETSGLSRCVGLGSVHPRQQLHPAAPSVAPQAPFPMLAGKTPGLEGGERCINWTD